MKILSHRGYWKTPEEKNADVAFKRSFSMGFGTETDIRDFMGRLVISHDIAHEASSSAAHLFELYKKFNSNVALALNIKADGLQHKLRELLDSYDIIDYFAFDMSVPDTLGYIKAGIKFYARQSEYEPNPALLEQADGVWVDAFISDWVGENHIEAHLEAGKNVCIVSPELHKREHRFFWDSLATMKCVSCDRLQLCTDYPEAAQEHFHG